MIEKKNSIFFRKRNKINFCKAFDGKNIFSKDLEVDGTASLNTIYSRFNDNVVLNGNLIITGNITLGGTSFNQKVDDEIMRDLMKENGIGRPSTRANIIETLFRRKYIERNKKQVLRNTRPKKRGLVYVE